MIGAEYCVSMDHWPCGAGEGPLRLVRSLNSHRSPAPENYSTAFNTLHRTISLAPAQAIGEAAVWVIVTMAGLP